MGASVQAEVDRASATSASSASDEASLAAPRCDRGRGSRGARTSSRTRRTSAATPSSMLASCLAQLDEHDDQRHSYADALRLYASKGNRAALERLEDAGAARRASLGFGGGVWSPRRAREGGGMSTSARAGGEPRHRGRSGSVPTTPATRRLEEDQADSTISASAARSRTRRRQMEEDSRWHGAEVRLRMRGVRSRSNPGCGRRVPGLATPVTRSVAAAAPGLRENGAVRRS